MSSRRICRQLCTVGLQILVQRLNFCRLRPHRPLSWLPHHLVFNRSLHKRPIKPCWFLVAGGVKKQIRADWLIGQGKQIQPVAARQIGAVLHDEVAAQHATQIEQRITDPQSQCQRRRDSYREKRTGTRGAACGVGHDYRVISGVGCARHLNRVCGIGCVEDGAAVKSPLVPEWSRAVDRYIE